MVAYIRLSLCDLYLIYSIPFNNIFQLPIVVANKLCDGKAQFIAAILMNQYVPIINHLTEYMIEACVCTYFDHLTSRDDSIKYWSNFNLSGAAINSRNCVGNVHNCIVIKEFLHECCCSHWICWIGETPANAWHFNHCKIKSSFRNSNFHQTRVGWNEADFTNWTISSKQRTSLYL